MARTRTAPAPKKRPVRRIIRWTAVAVAAVLLLFTFSLLYLRWLPPLTTTVHIQRRLEALAGGHKYQKRYEFVRLERISPHLQHAVVAGEDARFYQHHGIDWKELSHAAEEGLEEGRLGRGGSTITQQLIKNLFFTTHRSFLRKVPEFLLVPLTEFLLPKQRILELYLNVVEWGPGVYGAEAASRYHFGVPAARLDRERSARLAAILPSPRNRRPGRMDEYSGEILVRMSQMGW